MSKAKSKALKVTMGRKAFIKEHQHLTKVLKTGVGAKQEYKEQRAELKHYQ